MEPKINVDYDQLKIALRKGLSSEAREFWWPLLPQISEQKFAMSNYPDVNGSAERLLAMTWSQSPMEALRKDDTTESNHQLLMETLKSKNDLGASQDSILLEGFAQILLTTLSRFDVCHLICKDVMESKERRFTTTLKEYDCKLNIFRKLLENHMPKTYEALTALSALEDQYLNLMFMDFFKTILPKETVLRLVDSYLLEGDKILFRYGFALISGYKKFIKSKDYENAAEFWQTVQSDARKHEIFTVFEKSRDNFFLATLSDRSPGVKRRRSVKLVISDNELSMKNRDMTDYMTIDIHNTAFDKKRGSIQKALKPYKLSKSNIQTLTEAYYSKKRPSPLVPLTPPYYPSLGFYEVVTNGNSNSNSPAGTLKSRNSKMDLSPLSRNSSCKSLKSKGDLTPPSQRNLFGSDKNLPIRQESFRNTERLIGEQRSERDLDKKRLSVTRGDRGNESELVQRRNSVRLGDRGVSVSNLGGEAAFARRRSSVNHAERRMVHDGNENELAKRRSSVNHAERRMGHDGNENEFAKRRSSVSHGERRMGHGGNENELLQRRNSVRLGDRGVSVSNLGGETAFARRRSSVTQRDRNGGNESELAIRRSSVVRIDHTENGGAVEAEVTYDNIFAKRRSSVTRNRHSERTSELESDRVVKRVSLPDDCQSEKSVSTRQTSVSPLGRRNSRKLTESGNEEYRLQYSNVTVSEGLAKRSQVLTPHTAAQLFALCCPFIDSRQRLPLTYNEHFDHGLYPLFTTAAHGFFLASLYARTQEFSPLVFVIKSTVDRSRPQHVVGGYVTQPFKFPSFTTRGNGQSFLFRLAEEYAPAEEMKDRERDRERVESVRKGKATKYPWAENGHTRSSHDEQCRDLYRVHADSAARNTTGSGGTFSQFAVFAPSFISFGASENYGTNAIRIDSELSTCHCGPSDTYGNSTTSILGNQSEASFSIESVEIFGDKHSYDKLQQREREWSSKGKFSRRASATY